MYRGQCKGDKDEFEYNLVNLQYEDSSVNISKVGKNCQVDISITDCRVNLNAYIGIKLRNYYSFCSSIELFLASTSSINDELSSYYEAISSDNDKIFRGSVPTVFNLDLFSSLFTTPTKKQTGYHISSFGITNPGSSFKIEE